MTTFPVTGASCHITFNCMKSLVYMFFCVKVILIMEHYIELLAIFIWKFAIFWSWQLALWNLGQLAPASFFYLLWMKIYLKDIMKELFIWFKERIYLSSYFLFLDAIFEKMLILIQICENWLLKIALYRGEIFHTNRVIFNIVLYSFWYTEKRFGFKKINRTFDFKKLNQLNIYLRYEKFIW